MWGYNVEDIKPILKMQEGLNLCQFYYVRHVYFIPINRERKFGLFETENKRTHVELDQKLEKRLLNLTEDSSPEQYLKEIKKFNLDMKNLIIHYEQNKDKIEAKENKDFIDFLKNVGGLIGIIILIIIIKAIFF